MKTLLSPVSSVLLAFALCLSSPTRAVSVAEELPVALANSGKLTDGPLANAAFVPGPGARAAPDFAGAVRISQTAMQAAPAIEHPLQNGRDARLFPAVTLEFFTVDGLLVPVQRGEMVHESAHAHPRSFWQVIPQFGRIWRERSDGRWSRAAFPLTLVNDIDNHALQGLACFLYDGTRISQLRFQFIQQNAPYLLHQHFVTWGSAATTVTRYAPGDLADKRSAARAELAQRLPSKPWSELVRSLPPGTLDGFGGPLDPRWVIAAALVRNGVLFYQPAPTPYGDYPYPLEMRFGVRSITKSIVNPLALLRLAQTYGPWVLTLKVGDYVAGLDPKWKRVRLLDAVNMASGFGGVGSLKTNPNDGSDGTALGNYDSWFTAPSHAEKLQAINADLRPYPWEPGTVFRYRDQDMYLVGAAIDGFLKSVASPQPDHWDLVRTEVLAPIGIYHAPLVRTLEADGHEGLAWGSSGYYPTLDELAKIATLFQNLGAHAGHQLLHRQLTADLLAAKDAIRVKTDMSLDRSPPDEANTDEELYKMGFHFVPFVRSRSAGKLYLPQMTGFGENQVILFPNGLISLRMAKAAELPPGTVINSDAAKSTAQVVARFAPF
ncbi:MAG: hypothetical protein JOY91_03500 [Sinobacteraceae bacterium]|nr:hypothetical protein [Nevskiaceae bacterium]